MRPDLWYPGGDRTDYIVDAAGALVVCSLGLGMRCSSFLTCSSSSLILGVQLTLLSTGWRRVFEHKTEPRMRTPQSAMSISTATLAVLCVLSETLYCIGAVLHMRVTQVNLIGGSRPSPSAVLGVSCTVAVAMQCIVLLADALLVMRHSKL